MRARRPMLSILAAIGGGVGLSCSGGSNTDDYPFDLGERHVVVSTADRAASRWFDRGLSLAYAFNHEEAVRCFERALERDPDLAMAHWGIAYALGPNYNNVVMEDAAAERAWSAAARAMALSGEVTPRERALIEAIHTRYAWPQPDDRSDLDLAYAAAMRSASEAHPDDPDVAALRADAMMMLHPWALWSKDGEPAPVTPDLVSHLESSLARWPDHPALCHFYIHTMEPSPEPARALPAADALRDAMPDAGHLIHMPSHIDVLVGDYGNVIAENRKAIAADRKYVEHQGRVNFYTLYRIHNLHFLVYGAMFDGQYALALETAETIPSEIPPELMAQIPDFVEAFVPTTYHVWVRFGRWKEILAAAEPPADLPFTRAIHHYARTVALAALGRAEEAAAAHEILVARAAEVPSTRLLFNNSCADVLDIAIAMTAGEVAYRQGRFEEAFAELRRAVELDDALNYDEPWGWMQPARHALGALLLEQGSVEEAEAVYRADLRRFPRNGWALHGLAETLDRTGDAEGAARSRAERARAWSRADVKISASCFCRTGTPAG